MKKQRMLRGYGEIFCCFLLIAALFAGCALPGLSPDRRRHPSPILTESETETADTEPAETVPAEPVVRYAPVGKDVFFASVYEGPSGTVLIVLEPGDEDESDTGSSFVRRTSRTLLIYDPLWGRCTGMLALPFSATLSDHIYEDGTFSITDTDSSGGSVCSFYDALGRKKGSFSFDDASSFFVSSDKRSAYFAARHLMRKDLATGNIEMVPLPASMQVSDIREMLPDSDRLLLTLFTEPYGSDTCTGLFDPDTGEFVLLQREYFSWDGRTDQGVVTCADPKGGTAFLFWDGKGLQKLSAPPNTTWGEASIDGGFCVFHTEGTDDLLYSPSGNAFARLSASEDLASGVYYLAEYDAFFFLERNQNGKLVPTLIRNEFLSYTERTAPLDESRLQLVDETVLDAYAESGKDTALAPELASCRVKADLLEAKFGFRVLLSDECALLSQNAGFRVHPSSEWPRDEEIESIEKSLSVMDRLFSVYPDGFFKHFQKGADNGLLFMLTGKIESTYNVIAYERLEPVSRMYEIVFDMSYLYDLECTLIHELWHAIEDSTSDQFPYDAWNAVAPPGFSYQQAYENAVPIEGWTLYHSDPEDIYFVDEYSKTFAKEDRARIIEYFFGRETLRSDLLEAPHLVEKYRILIEHIRRTFDTEQWPERTAWEILP